MAKQKLLVSNTVVLARSNLFFVTGATVSTGNVVNIPIAKYVKRIYVKFQNLVVANVLDAARFSLIEAVTSSDYAVWFRNDLAALNYGLIEQSEYTEFRYFKISSAAQHMFSWFINVNNDIDFLQMVFTRAGSQMTYEVFIQDE